MRRIRALLTGLIIGATMLLAGASGTMAGSVDPSTLTPPPPPGARCFTTGADRVHCDTVLNDTFENVPDLELPCGIVYLTGTDFRDGYRFYEDGLIVRRHVTAALDAIATLSPTGEGPSVRLTSHRNWWSVWPVPGGGDEDALTTQGGLDLRISGPGIGASFQIAGLFDPEGNHSGIFTAFSDEAIDLLCNALVG